MNRFKRLKVNILMATVVVAVLTLAVLWSSSGNTPYTSTMFGYPCRTSGKFEFIQGWKMKTYAFKDPPERVRIAIEQELTSKGGVDLGPKDEPTLWSEERELVMFELSPPEGSVKFESDTCFVSLVQESWWDRFIPPLFRSRPTRSPWTVSSP